MTTNKYKKHTKKKVKIARALHIHIIYNIATFGGDTLHYMRWYASRKNWNLCNSEMGTGPVACERSAWTGALWWLTVSFWEGEGVTQATILGRSSLPDDIVQVTVDFGEEGISKAPLLLRVRTVPDVSGSSYGRSSHHRALVWPVRIDARLHGAGRIWEA